MVYRIREDIPSLRASMKEGTEVLLGEKKKYVEGRKIGRIEESGGQPLMRHRQEQSWKEPNKLSSVILKLLCKGLQSQLRDS